MRNISAARVFITFGPLHLVESLQVKKVDFSHKVRGNQCLSETYEEEDNGNFLRTAQRGLEEELELYIPLERFKFMEMVKEIKPSPSSGVVTSYEFHDYQLELTEEEFLSAKLVANEGENYTLFEWVIQ